METNINAMSAQRGQRHGMETLGKDLPATSIFLNLSSLDQNVKRHGNMRSDANNSFDYLSEIDEEELGRSCCSVPNNSSQSSIPEIKKQIDIESDESLSESLNHKYEILISESSGDSSDNYNDNGNKFIPEELISLVGHSKFYIPHLITSNKDQLNVCKIDCHLYSSSNIKNDLCRPMNADKGDACSSLSLANFVPTDQTPECNQKLLDNHDKVSAEQTAEKNTPLKLAIDGENFFTNNSDDDDTNYQINKKSDSNDTLPKAPDMHAQIKSHDSQIGISEIAKALAKTTELTSTAQIKQRLAARKLEIELDNIGEEYVTLKDDLNHQQCANQVYTQHQSVVLKSSTCNTVNLGKIDDGSSMISSFDRSLSEMPRELLKYLIRMGSFNSAPKINNIDNQDNNFQLPENLNGDTLLQHVRQLHDCNELPLLRRYFKRSASSTLIHTKISSSSCSSYLKLASDLTHPNDKDAFAYANSRRIRILQWNLLSQTLGQYNDGFIRCPDKALTWQHRKFLIVEEILRNVPDVICLQEVDHFKFLQNVLNSQNYEGVFFPKPDSPCLYIKENNGPDGCAIFFKRDKYEMKKFGTHILEVWRMQSNQVVIAINLLIKALNCEICVCTTHLKARRSSLLAKLRNEQGRDLLRYIKRFADDRPIILCGDFNAEPIEPVYSTILNCDFLNLSSAYADIYNESNICQNMDALDDDSNENYCKNNDRVQKSISNEPPYTTWKIRENGEECHTIDYIFYSNNQFKVRDCLEFPQENEIGKDRVPSYQYPSDHFALVCDLEMTTTSTQ